MAFESERYGEIPDIDHPRWDGFARLVAGALERPYPVVVTGEIYSGEAEIEATNHFSNGEIITNTLATLEYTGKPPALMGKHPIFWLPHGPLFRRLGGFPVRRGNASMPDLIAYAHNAREEGRSTTIRSEASRHKGEKDPLEIVRESLRPGAFIIAEELGMMLRFSATVMRGNRENVVRYGELVDPKGMTLDDLYEGMQGTLDDAVFDTIELFGEKEGFDYPYAA